MVEAAAAIAGDGGSVIHGQCVPLGDEGLPYAAHAETLRMYEHLLELWDLVADPVSVASRRADHRRARSRGRR